MFTSLVCLLLLQTPSAPIAWQDVRQFGVEGQGWTETKEPFDRYPARAEKLVRPPVWSLSRDSAGLSVRFSTDATTIRVRWSLRNPALALPHMPATGVSGLDLYVLQEGRWRWLANGRPEKPSNEQALVEKWTGGKRDYLLYFPLYNGVRSVEIGVPTGARIERGAAWPVGVRPVVFYGTSILQGGCASRPGMAYPSIVGRMLDRPTINLGFSGNGRSEPEVAGLLAELNPAAYVLDSLPNLGAEQVRQRVEPFIARLRQAHPTTPIVLVENIIYTNADFVEERRKNYSEKNAALRSIFLKLRKAGDRKLYYVPATNLLGADGEATVDGTHPTDLGFLRMAETIAPVLRRALK
jgi:lysophospholipase L1-like esterase